LQAAIADRLGALTRTLEQALAEAGLDGERIDAVFLTGGSTAIPAVRAVVTARTPRAAIVEGDLLARSDWDWAWTRGANSDVSGPIIATDLPLAKLNR